MKKTLLCLFIIIPLLVNSTSIIIVILNGQLIVGADSKVHQISNDPDFRNGGSKRNKIQKIKKDLFFTSAGFDGKHDGTQSTLKIVVTNLQDFDVDIAIKNIQMQIVDSFHVWRAIGLEKAPEVWKRMPTLQPIFFDLCIFGFDSQIKPFCKQMRFVHSEKNSDSLIIEVNPLTTNDTPDPLFFFQGNQKGARQYHSKEWSRFNNQTLPFPFTDWMEKLLDVEVNRDTSFVGYPLLFLSLAPNQPERWWTVKSKRITW